MANVTAYVDGFNLYFGLKSKFGRRHLWLDVVELVRQLRPADTITTVRYFTAIVKGEPDAAANQIGYLDALEAHCGPTVDIERGWFKRRSIARCKLCGAHYECRCPSRYRSHEEKETDVALGAFMVEDAALANGDLTLLVSADSDFAPAVRSVKRIAPSRPVILAMPPGNLKPHKKFENVGYFSINETSLRRAQLPDVVTNPATGTEHRRPAKWS